MNKGIQARKQEEDEREEEEEWKERKEESGAMAMDWRGKIVDIYIYINSDMPASFSHNNENGRQRSNKPFVQTSSIKMSSLRTKDQNATKTQTSGTKNVFFPFISSLRWRKQKL